MTTRELVHGKNTTYQAGCHCDDCRRAHAASQTAWRQRRIDGRTTVDMLGARRRIQALMALGWPRRELGRRLDHNKDSMQGIITVHSRITLDLHRRVCDLYEQLCMTPGPSATSRRLAAAKGWPPPLAWDDIDDPNEQPDFGSPPVADLVDPVVVQRILAGQPTPATLAERYEVTRRWISSGRPWKQLEDLTGWKVDRYIIRPEPTAA